MGVTTRDVLVILDLILMLPGLHLVPVLTSQPQALRVPETLRRHDDRVPHSLDRSHPQFHPESHSQSYAQSHTPGSVPFDGRLPDISPAAKKPGQSHSVGPSRTRDQPGTESHFTPADLVRAWTVFRTEVQRRSLLHESLFPSHGKRALVTKQSEPDTHPPDTARISTEDAEGQAHSSRGKIISSAVEPPQHHFSSSLLRKRDEPRSPQTADTVKDGEVYVAHASSSNHGNNFLKAPAAVASASADANATAVPNGNSTSVEDSVLSFDTQAVSSNGNATTSNDLVSTDDSSVPLDGSGSEPGKPSDKSAVGRQKRSFYVYDLARDVGNAAGELGLQHVQHPTPFPRLEKLKALYLGLLRTKNTSHNYVERRFSENENADSVSVPERRFASSNTLSSSRKPVDVSEPRQTDNESAMLARTLGASRAKEALFGKERYANDLKYRRMKENFERYLLRLILNSSGSPPRGQKARKSGMLYSRNVPLLSQNQAKDVYHYDGDADVNVLMKKVPGGVPLQGKDFPIVIKTRSGGLTREELVRRLHQPSRLQTLQAETSLTMDRDRQDKQKKERLLHDLLQDATPLDQTDLAETGAVCGGSGSGDASAQEMSCPSDASVCLVDFMFCDGITDCPQGEDEASSLCILRLWAFTWVKHIQHMLTTYYAYSSRDIPQRSRGHKRTSRDRNGES